MSRPSLSVVVPVYRRAEQACAALAALFDQSLPDEVAMEIIVVDDGSDDGTAAHIDAMFGTRIRLLRMPTNRGRAEARSRGIADARSERIVLLDCDCVPAHRHYLSTLWACFEGGAAIVAGPISGYGGTFWDRYQRLGSTRRAKQIRAGIPGVGSSANLAFDKQTYLAAGGFDPRYRHYGFEDRDLLLRLGLHGRLMWADEAEVRHMDALSMREICNKMREAGRHSAGLFASEHPEALRPVRLRRTRHACAPLAALGCHGDVSRRAVAEPHRGSSYRLVDPAVPAPSRYGQGRNRPGLHAGHLAGAEGCGALTGARAVSPQRRAGGNGRPLHVRSNRIAARHPAAPARPGAVRRRGPPAPPGTLAPER